jgi:hypothetical protein
MYTFPYDFVIFEGCKTAWLPCCVHEFHRFLFENLVLWASGS